MTYKEWLGEDNILGHDIWNNKYRHNNETFDHWIDRVSMNDSEIKNLILKKKFLFAGRTLRNLGTGNGQSLSNCYSSGYAPDSVEGMMNLNRDIALTYKSEGGQGISLSEIRPKGAEVKGGLFKSDGIIPFMEIFNQTTASISQGGSRKGALMMSLDAFHPEIMDFINVKKNNDAITKANLSVEVSDSFMETVVSSYNEKKDIEIKTSFKHPSGTHENVCKPIDIYKQMMLMAWDNAEPGIIYTDRFRNYNLMQYVDKYKIITGNPCLHPDTIVETSEGKVKIKDMTKSMMVYSKDKDGKLVLKKSSASWVTKKNAEILNIEISNGKVLKVTPDHNIFIKDKGWVEAQDLKINDIPVALLRRRRGVKYSGVRLSSQDREEEVMEHKFVFEGTFGKICEGYDIYHTDCDSYNNSFDNLEMLTHSEYSSLTGYSCDNECHAEGFIPMPKELQSGFKATPRIRSISIGKMVDVYDITVEDTNNFVAEGIIVHNCGEQSLPKDGACNLASFNMGEYIIDPFTKHARFDYESLKKDIRIAIRALDKTLDLGMELHAIEGQKEMAKNYRNIGLGSMGMADAMLKIGLKYGSEESVNFVKKISALLFKEAVLTSNKLARELGAFPEYTDEVMDADILKKVFSEKEISELKKDGLRNCSLITVAPTGSIGTLIEASTGVEPVFMMSYTRRTESLHGSRDVEYKVYHKTAKDYITKTGNKNFPDYFITSQEIPWRGRVNVQAAMQEFTDTAISSTVNLSNETTVGEVEEMYIYAWKMGLKGITMFRDGCNRSVILSKSGATKEVVEHKLVYGDKWKLEDNAVEYYKRKIIIGCGEVTVMIGLEKATGRFYDLYTIGSIRGCTSNINTIAILLSNAIRFGATVESFKNAMDGSTGCTSFAAARAKNKPLSKGKNCGTSIVNTIMSTIKEVSDGVVIATPKVLREPVEDIVEDKKGKCPECGAELLNTGGCSSCIECGFSYCG